MKILDRILILIFTMCLIIVSIWFSAVPIAKNASYYHLQFKVNDIYEHENSEGETVQTVFYYLDGKYQKAKFTDEQLDAMVDHIIDFLFGNKESFELELEGVSVYNKSTGTYEVIEEPVSIFGEAAVTHMNDVKQLFIIFQIISVIAFVMVLGIFAYILIRISQVRKIMFEYTMLFYAGFVTILSIFGVITFLNFVADVLKHDLPIHSNPYFSLDHFISVAWGNFHFFFFPFQPDKIEGSFFNDILTEILTIDLFVVAVVICLVVLVIVQLIWLAFCLIVKVFGGRIGNKIKQFQHSTTLPEPTRNTSQNS